MKNLFHINYNFKLIKLMLKMSLFGALSSNVLAPFIIIYIVHGYLPNNLLLIWFLFHLSLFFSRVFIGLKLRKTLNSDNDLTTKYLYSFYIILFFSALLNGIIVWLSILYKIPDLEILVLVSIILALSAGALSTLSSIFLGYIIYLSVSILLLITAVIYHGGEMFYVLAFNLSVFYAIFVVAGYKHHITLRKAISLEDTFKTVYENSSDGVIIIQNNRFKDCNVSILKMFGFDTKDEFINSDLSKLSPKYQPDGKLSMVKMLRMTRKASREGSSSFEWIHTRKDGEEFWCEIVLTKIQLEGKDLLHGAWRDISQRKGLEVLEAKNKEELERRVEKAIEVNMMKDRQLLHQSRLAQMGEMIGMIAHQWRQPLSAITSASTSIALKSEMGSLDKDTVKKLSANINSYAKHLSDTIDAFRDFFKPNNEKEYTDYNQLLKSVLGIINGSIKDKNIELIKDMNCDEEIYLYPNELKQVILNLVKNSEDILIDNNIKNPYIKIATYSDGDNCILEVSDNGGGISEDIFDKIFDPYFSTKLKKDGTGMGLYMSKIIVEEHCNGELNALNGDEGAVFKIVISKANY